MNIGFEGSVLSLPFPSGTKEYAHNLLKNLAEMKTDDTFTVFGRGDMDLPEGNFQRVIIPNNIPIFKKQLLLGHVVKKTDIDIFHYLEPFGSIFPVHKKTITTVHDIDLSKTYPWFSKGLLHRLYCEPMRYGVLKSTSTIITGTKQIRREVMNYLQKKGFHSRVQTIPWGYDVDSFGLKPKKNKGKREQYFLCMGDFAPRKNIKKVFQAYRSYRRHGTSKLFLVISSEKYLPQYAQLLRQSGLDPTTVKMNVNISKHQLADLYANAIAFLYPSLYEGFGIPLLEAMASGCPVITSDYGAMSEVVDQAAVLVNPRSEIEISVAMRQIETNENLAKKLAHRGTLRALKFSWQLNAKKTHDEYINMMKKLSYK
jgi:glycosyltransferase involved in cell wall biosynthesis